MTNTTDQRLREIQERVEKATPGPWFYDDINGVVESHGVRDPVSEPTHDWEYRTIVDGAYWTNPEADCALIANAPADLAWLLEQLAALRLIEARAQTMLAREPWPGSIAADAFRFILTGEAPVTETTSDEIVPGSHFEFTDNAARRELMDNQQQDTPQRYGGSIWGEGFEQINCVGNTLEEVLTNLRNAALLKDPGRGRLPGYDRSNPGTYDNPNTEGG